jgi:hypothetical protein
MLLLLLSVFTLLLLLDRFYHTLARISHRLAVSPPFTMPSVTSTAQSDHYQQWLKSLRSMPEPEAAKALREALLKGTRPGGVTFTRADCYEFHEQVHHYFGCPEDSPCDDAETQVNLLPWEEELLVPIDEIIDESVNVAMANYFAWTQISLETVKFGTLIKDRWLKKSVSQRKATLLKACPEMPLKHRPDMVCCVLEACPHQRHFNAMADYAFPHLNVEDLTKPSPLLILLDARSHNAPFKFAYSDLELAPLLRLRPAILKSTKFTMSLNNGEYGFVKGWDKEEEAMAAIEKGSAVHPAQGFQVLTMQNNMYRFLLDCIREILPDKKEELDSLTIPEGFFRLAQACSRTTEGNDGLDQLLPPHLSDYSSLDVIAREASYRVPMLSDLGRLQVLVEAGKNAAEDHIWLLREDPGYFAEAMMEKREHRPELLPGSTCGQYHKHRHDDILWPRVLRDGVTDCYVDVFVWDEIHQRISKLNKLAQQYAEHLGKDQWGTRLRLPKDFSQCLTEAWFFLEAVQLDLIQQLKLGWPSSLEIRAHFAQMCEPDADNIVIGIKFTKKGSRKRDKELEHIFQLFQYLWEFPVRQTLKVHVLVDALEHLLQNNPRAKFLTSPWVASLLSKLSIVAECLRQLNFFQPWAKRVAYNVKRQQTKLLIAHCLNFSKWNCILQTSFEGTDLAELGRPTGSKFRYPVKKRRSQATIEIMRASEDSLDAFWSAADARFKKCTGTTPHDIVRHIIRERTLQRTPPWIEPSKSEVSVQPAEDYIYIPFSNALHDPSKQITCTFDRPVAKTKEAAKCETVPSLSVSSCDSQELEDDEYEQPVFHVDKRAHKVFRILFHSPSSRDHSGDVPWQDFLYAMVQVGFAVEKLQGSAWQFTPRSLDVEHPIQFHEPHPTHKLPFTWARRNGRRLFRTYGWTSEMFQLDG